MKQLLFVPLVLLSLMFSCNEKVLSAGQDYLKISDAYTQKEVPGQSDAKTRDYLKIMLDIKNPAETKVTEVIFRNQSYAINSSIKRLKIDIASGTSSTKKESLKNNEAKVFYTVADKNYVVTIKNIVTKPAVFLP